MRKLTIGFATHDDFDGLYFSIQAIRIYHKEVLDDIEFVIVDNNPSSKHGESVRKLVEWVKEPVQYLPYTKHQSTTVKNKIFDLAETPYVMSLDSHVLLEPGSLKKLIDFYDSGKDNHNLLHGPLLYDDGISVSTHFDLSQWGGYMWGKWATDPRGVDPNNPPFEIPGNGCGLFSSRKDAWLGFNRHFRGFGGEEGYIHEKYRKNGRKVLCLPFLRWVHRFERPNGSHYPNRIVDRFRNYLIGFTELGLPTDELYNQFKNSISDEEIENVKEEIRKIS